MTTINGSTYSKESFPGYENRIKVQILDTELQVHGIDIYTDEPSFEKAFIDIKSVATSRVLEIDFIYVSSRHEDEANSEFLKDFLKD